MWCNPYPLSSLVEISIAMQSLRNHTWGGGGWHVVTQTSDHQDRHWASEAQYRLCCILMNKYGLREVKGLAHGPN